VTRRARWLDDYPDTLFQECLNHLAWCDGETGECRQFALSLIKTAQQRGLRWLSFGRPTRSATAVPLMDRHKGPVNALAVLPGSRVISGGEDRKVWLWDVDTGQTQALGELPTAVRTLAAVHGDVLAAGCADGTVWIRSRGQEWQKLIDFGGGQRLLRFHSSAGRTLVTAVGFGGGDGGSAIRIADLETTAHFGPIAPHSSFVMDVVVAGNRVVSVGGVEEGFTLKYSRLAEGIVERVVAAEHAGTLVLLGDDRPVTCGSYTQASPRMRLTASTRASSVRSSSLQA
jgi:WD40 repeat protein